MKANSFSGFSRNLDSWVRNLSQTGRGRKQAFSMLVDSMLAVASLWCAYSLRHGQSFSDFRSTWQIFLLLPFVTVVAFSGLGIYRWMVRSSNRNLFQQLIKGAFASAMGLVLLVILIPPDRVTPRSLFVIYAMLLLIGTCGSRLIWQGLFDSNRKGEPIAIYGAGMAGRRLAMLLEAEGGYRPAMFIDDNPALQTTTVRGLCVYSGDHAGLKGELVKREVSRIVLAMPSMDGARFTERLRQVESLGVTVQTGPSIGELLSGEMIKPTIRDISITDVLGRAEVPPDPALLGACVSNKVVLVTGGGGSIGSELCRQIISQAPSKLVVVDNCEANLYHITEELGPYVNAEGTSAFVPLLYSVTNAVDMARVIDEHGVNTVYHAAAYKHVPIIENQPSQGFKVNVLGTLTVLEAAIAQRVDTFVLISTDKAVRPANAMGASKRVAEMVLQAKSREQISTRICMVRFGNVLGSSGSVVPKFKQQILAGGPISITHRDITRFFMTIPEAAQLVLQASAIAKGGDVFVLDMGEPVKIMDLATTMVHLYGKQLQSETGKSTDIAIVESGLRPGEKMYEELFIDGAHEKTEVSKVYTADETWLTWNELNEALTVLRGLANSGDSIAVKSNLMSLAFAGQGGADDGSPLKARGITTIPGEESFSQHHSDETIERAEAENHSA